MSSSNRLTPEGLVAAYRALLQGESGLLLAVSGGPDSQALLHVTSRLRARLGLKRLVAVGIDHGLRDAAASELDVAAALAERQGVAFFRLKIRAPPQGNRLAWARRVRYHALHRLRAHLRLPLLATGHIADDQLEHVLMSLCRGRGTRSLAGMPARRGKLIRPLLDVPREAIQAYLLAQNVEAAQDPSNADVARDRGWLRAKVIPHIVQRAPHVTAHTAQMTRWLREDERYLEKLATESWVALRAPDRSLCARALFAAAVPLQTRVFRLWLESWGGAMGQKAFARLSAALEDHVRTGRVHRVGVLGGRVFFQHQRLYCAPKLSAAPLCATARVLVANGPPLIFQALGKSLSMVTRDDVRTQLLTCRAPDRDSVAFDADRLHLGLWVRAWQKGDVLQPWGHCGHVKIGNLFTNLKVPEPLRKHWPVVLHGSEIVWVAGLRRGQTAAITQATRSAWVVQFRSVEATRLESIDFQ